MITAAAAAVLGGLVVVVVVVSYFIDRFTAKLAYFYFLNFVLKFCCHCSCDGHTERTTTKTSPGKSAYKSSIPDIYIYSVCVCMGGVCVCACACAC